MRVKGILNAKNDDVTDYLARAVSMCLKFDKPTPLVPRGSRGRCRSDRHPFFFFKKENGKTALNAYECWPMSSLSWC